MKTRRLLLYPIEIVYRAIRKKISQAEMKLYKHNSYSAQRAKCSICASKSHPILRNLIMDKPFAATCTEINVQSTPGQ